MARSTHSDFQASEPCGEVERSVALVCEIWVLEVAGVILDDALDEREVVQVDGTAEAERGVDPAYSS